ncbi:DHBP synthase RibB-like alpha/beta domain-containing protein [Macrophomina phaseolina]|uniref:Threonylcarbamoyl-AMP synthase n=1 Tax=Macrophomina phaseolina TaxID=35725 RepID=A0ABQ8GUK7_9PEZI|nr:DHBP synthase RibB-like alpha/beta domain-containing protein [Macrophomina phaseolina]
MPTLPNACINRSATSLARSICSPVSLRSVTAGSPRRIATMNAASEPTANGHPTPTTTTIAPETRILPVDASKLGKITLFRPCPDALLEDWDITWAESGADIAHLRQAARELQEGVLPVAFPTETVYGLGADATSSSAVRGIYKAKQRPSDNPLIVHIASLSQLRQLLQPTNTTAPTNPADLIPTIYHSLIRRFWPGPSPSSSHSPDNPLAARPRSNRRPAHLRRAPTAAEHVAHDLARRIATILDGGPCDVGVESTVVDGISGDTPVILRPGGVSIDELRRCEGWENVGVAYKDKAEMGSSHGDAANGKREAPRAPGMKYRHYSPKARVVLFEAGTGVPGRETVRGKRRVGTIRTKRWPRGCGLPGVTLETLDDQTVAEQESVAPPVTNGVAASLSSSSSQGFSKMLETLTVRPTPKPRRLVSSVDEDQEVWEVNLGAETKDIARGLFSALRELDRKDVDVILVEGIDEREGDVAAAIMNRLRKAAEVEVKGS